jgi:hypothetical protein
MLPGLTPGRIFRLELGGAEPILQRCEEGTVREAEREQVQRREAKPDLRSGKVMGKAIFLCTLENPFGQSKGGPD